MTTVSVRFMGQVAADFGTRRTEVPISDNFTLSDLLKTLGSSHPAKFGDYFSEDLSPKRGTILLVNGSDYDVMGGLETPLGGGDEVVVVPTVSGG